MRTRLTSMLRIEHPVMLAGMGGVSYSALVGAVSQAGGFGCLGAATMSKDQLVGEIQAIREITGRPFGVDLLTALPGDLEAQVEVAIEGGMSLFVAGLGIPTQVIDRCHRAGVLVGSMCGKVEHAVRAVEAGCDLVIAQGTEAGGHTGMVATMPLVPQVVDAVGRRVPVVAAGGIMDGRGLAAALALGADGVWVGTRFVATPEAHVVPGFHQAMLDAREDATVITRSFSGKPMRALRNQWTEHHEAHPEEILPFPAQAARSVQEGVLHLGLGPEAEIDPAKECFPTGQAVGAVNEVVPAADILRRMVSDAERTLKRVYTLTS